ncbi:MAG: hypothetical protein C6I05_05540, partial [Epsilonproteobacteria bacterium]|nr:hypothetical protein [Campylobacterota bacterium]
ISTKRVNDDREKFFTFTVTSYDKDDPSKLVPFKGTVCARIVSSECNSDEICTHGGWTRLYFNNETEKTFSLCATRAVKDARIELRWATKDVPCSMIDKVEGYQQRLSTDNFSIMPDHFKIVAPSVVKAGEDFEIKFRVEDIIENKPVPGYNEKVGESFEVVVKDKNSNAILGVFTPKIDEGWHFVDGLKKITTNYSDIGVLEITIREKKATHFASVDDSDPLLPPYWNPVDDPNYVPTSYDELQNKLRKYIIPATTTITVIPDHFDISITGQNKINDCYTYLAQDNLVNTGAPISYTVTAKGKSGNTLKNFDKNSYAEDVGLTFITFLESDDPKPDELVDRLQKEIFVLHSSPGTLQEAELKRLTPSNVDSFSFGSLPFASFFENIAHILPFFGGSHHSSNGWDDLTREIAKKMWSEGYSVVAVALPHVEIPKGDFTQGVGSGKIFLNFPRSTTEPVNPFKLHIKYAQALTEYGSEKIVADTGYSSLGVLSYYYGRVYGGDSQTNSITGNEGDVSLHYEVYDSLNPPFKDPSRIEGNKNPQEDHWFLNLSHTAPAYGRVLQILHEGKNILAESTSLLDRATLEAIDQGIQKLHLKYKGSTMPYTASLRLIPDSWLLYNRNGDNFIPMEVLFKRDGVWTGIGEKGETSPIEGADETNRRTTW